MTDKKEMKTKKEMKERRKERERRKEVRKRRKREKEKKKHIQHYFFLYFLIVNYKFTLSRNNLRDYLVLRLNYSQHI